LTSSEQSLIQESDNFMKEHRENPLGWVGTGLRFVRRCRHFPPFCIREEFRDDYNVHRSLAAAIDAWNKKENKGRTIVFDSPLIYRVLSREELATVDFDNAHKVLDMLRAFFKIHDLEGNCSSSLIPMTELTDELDDLIIRFRAERRKTDSEYSELLKDLRRLETRIRRRKVQGATSALFLILTLLLLTPSPFSAALAFLITAGLLGLLFAVPSLLLTYVTVWRSFLPLMSDK
jgi:hypothetical protein